MRKKAAALLLAACIAAGSMPHVGAYEEVLNETFESGAAHWTLENTNEINTVQIKEQDGNRAAVIKAAGGGLPTLTAGFAAVNEAFVAEAKILVKQSGGDAALSLVDTKGTKTGLVNFSSDSQIYVVDGSTSRQVMSYSLARWYRVALAVDPQAGTYAVTVNGEEVLKNISLPRQGAGGAAFAAAEGINALAVDAYQGNEYGYTTVLWDDLRVYVGTEVRRDEQFESVSAAAPAGPQSTPQQSSVGKWGFADGQNIIMLPDRTAVAADERLLSYDRFVDDFTGRLPRYGWNNYTGGNLASIETIAKDGDAQNKAIRMESVNANHCNEQKLFEENPLSEDITVEAKFYVEKLGPVQGINLAQSPHFCEILTLDSTGNIVWQDGTVVGSYAAGEWVKVAVAVYYDARTADCYINGVKTHSQLPITFSGTGFNAIRFFSNYGVTYLDDVYIYRGTDPLDTEAFPNGTFVTYKNLMNDDSAVLARLGSGTIAMKLNSEIAYVDGSRTTISPEGEQVAPFLHGDRTVVPVRFILENLGYTIHWDETSNVVTAQKGTSVITISLTDGVMTSSLDEDKRTYDCVVEDGRCYVPLRVLANWIGKRIYWNDDGVCIVCDNQNLFDEQEDAELIEKLYRMLTFTRPSGESILQDIQKRFPGYAHNRLYLTDERLEKIQQRCEQGDQETISWVEKYVADAERYLGGNPLDYAIPDGKRLLDTSRTMEGRFIMYAVAYRLSGDERFAEQCWKEMQHIAAYPNWNETHFLDTAEMCRGFAIAYDTFHDWMDEEQRELCVDTIREKALYPALYEYRYGNGATHNEWANGAGNWNPVCNAGMMIGAVAIAEDDEELAAEILESALIGLEGNLVEFAPDGAWPEGPGYWHYTIEFLSYALDSLYTSTGTIYNYLNVAGIGDTAKYYLYMMGPGGIFNYGDMTPQYVKSPELYWYSEVMQDGTLGALYKDLADEYNFGTSITSMLHYDKELIESSEKTAYPYDKYFRKWWVGSLRSSWTISDATFVAFQGGRPNAGHSQMSMGNFVLDSMGERWALDLGYDDYNIGYLDISENARAWWIYRKSTEGHNCFLLNPDDKVPQVYNSDSPISSFESEEMGGYAVIDLSPAYARQANWAQRGFKLDRSTEIVTVQDEFEYKTPNSEYYWFMHTEADIEIAEDGKSAILSQNGKRLWVEIKQPSNAVFTVMDTKVLPTSGDSGVRDLEAKNEGVSKLAIHLTGLSGQNTVSVSMVGLKDPSLTEPLVPIPEAEPIADWSIPKTKLEFAQLSGIQVGGETIDTFTPEKYNYTVKLPFGTTQAPEVTAAGAGEVEITQAEGLPGTATIKAQEEGKVDSYSLISFKVQPLLNAEPEDYRRAKIKKVTASQVPQEMNTPENTLDGDYASKWAANGEAWIQYELDSAKTIKSFMASWMSGDERLQYFDMQVSMDGQTWKTLFSGESSGETDNNECYMVENTQAKYVRLLVHGTSQGSWTSLQEFAVYE